MASKVKYEKNSRIKNIVLDVLKPYLPPLPEFASFLTELEGIEKVDITLVEIDEKTESLNVTLNGSNINFDALKELMEECGAVIHSVDQVIAEK
jgi:hypothetical protein